MVDGGGSTDACGNVKEVPVRAYHQAPQQAARITRADRHLLNSTRAGGLVVGH